MRNLKLILSYDGTDFAGWQVQPGRATVQGTLASAIGRLSGENVLPQGSGRTDAGVHALAQVASFQTASTIPIENWALALNHILPPSIRVLEVSEAAADFHARKSARAKTYRYRIYRGAICPPFMARYVWHYPYPLDEGGDDARRLAVIVGEHDFTSFAAVDPERVERMSGQAEGMEKLRAVRAYQCPTDFFLHLDARRRRADVYRSRQRISPSHGTQSGGDIRSGREGKHKPGRFRAHPRSA